MPHRGFTCPKLFYYLFVYVFCHSIFISSIGIKSVEFQGQTKTLARFIFKSIRRWMYLIFLSILKIFCELNEIVYASLVVVNVYLSCKILAFFILHTAQESELLEKWS